MAESKSTQLHRVILEFGILIQPFRELAAVSTPPTEADYRLAIAKVRGGDPAWRERVRAFTAFAPDVHFAQEFQAISHVPERLWQRVATPFDTSHMRNDLGGVHERFRVYIDEAEREFFKLIAKVPVEWEPKLFPANTPFTSYLQILECTAGVRHRLHYFDRYLKADFFDLFLRQVPRDLEVRLVTTATGVQAVDAVSNLARAEFSDYQLLRVAPADLHDRNLRVDDRVFSLGPGVDRAGVALTNFGPAEDSTQAQTALDQVIAASIIIHQS